MKIGDRVNTPYGDGVIIDKESNRVELRYGVQLDYTDKVPWGSDDAPNMKYPKNKVLYFFKKELKRIKLLTQKLTHQQI